MLQLHNVIYLIHTKWMYKVVRFGGETSTTSDIFMIPLWRLEMKKNHQTRLRKCFDAFELCCFMLCVSKQTVDEIIIYVLL